MEGETVMFDTMYILNNLIHVLFNPAAFLLLGLILLFSILLSLRNIEKETALRIGDC